MSDIVAIPSKVFHTLATLNTLHDGAVLEFQREPRPKPDDMIDVHLLDGSVRTLLVEQDCDSGRLTVSVPVPLGYVHIDLVAEAGSKLRRWRIDYGPGREGLDLGDWPSIGGDNR